MSEKNDYKKCTLILIISLLFTCPHTADLMAYPASLQQEMDWKIGAKIHFEEETDNDYIGLKEINYATKNILKKTFHIKIDSCEENAKILLKKENGDIKIDHYTEKMNPYVGEEMHNTLLYTTARGFCQSETFKQVYPYLFEDCTKPLSIEDVANKYSLIIDPNWRFKIFKIVAHKYQNSTTFSAQLLFNDKENIYFNSNPISAGLHMTLIQCQDPSIFENDILIDQILEYLNQHLQGKLIKIAPKNGIADLEFGISGTTWRIRAGQKIELNK